MMLRATIEQSGKTATGIGVPAEVIDGLGAGKRPAVRITINGHGYRSTVGFIGGVPMIPLSADNRQSAGVAAGDEVDVELELDTEPREVEVPADLAAALEREAGACRAFDQLSYSGTRRHVLAVESPRTAGTRERRIGTVIASLRQDSGAQ